MKTILSLSVVLLFVTACGGGSGKEVAGPPPVEQPPVVEMPDTPDPEPEMEQETEPAYCYSTQEGELIDFLEDVLDNDPGKYGRPGFVVRWEQSPTLRIAEGTSDRYKRLTEESVDLINQSLPDDYKIRIGEPAPPRSETVRNGEIHIDFAPRSEWVGITAIHGAAVASRKNFVDLESPIKAYHVWIATDGRETQFKYNRHIIALCDKFFLGSITHELLHTLGFSHSKPRWNIGPAWRTIMAFGIPSCLLAAEELRNLQIPGVLDKDALRAMYEELDNGDYPEELRIEPEQECE